MKIKKYEVNDMKEALRQIKQDLGPDAVILSTRKVTRPSGLGLFPRPVLEVTAAVEYEKNEEPIVRTVQDNPVPRNTPQAAYAQEAANPMIKSQTYRSTANSRDDDDAYIRSLVESTKDHDVSLSENLLSSTSKKAYAPQVSSSPTDVIDANKLANVISALGLDKISSLVGDIGDIKRQLAEVKDTLNDPANMTIDLPANLKEFYSLLLKNGMDELLCYRFLKGVERKVPELAGRSHLQNIITDELASQIPIEYDMASALHKKVVAFVGPTGVGKTTTIAKVAAHFVLKYTQRICMITSDNFRIGAVDQLKMYADIVKIPLYMVSGPEDLASLLDGIQSEFDYILLDTTGRSPYDEDKLNDIAAYLEVSPDIVTVLVMSIAGNQAELGEVYERYNPLNPEYVIFTKVDETRYYGTLANIPMKKKTPLLLLSTGQSVPDDLELPDGKKIARLLLQEMPVLWKEI